MIADATGGREDAVLDMETFARGLTADVQLYNTKSETWYSTILNDIFLHGLTSVTTGTKMEVDDEESLMTGDEEGASIKGDKEFEINTLFNFSQLDFTANNVVSSHHVVLMQLVLVFSHFFYMYHAGLEFSVCDNTGFGCKMANAILIWLQIMVKLV